MVQITARAAAGAVQGDNFGFVVLRRGSDVRRIPYAFWVSRPSLTGRAGDAAAGDCRRATRASRRGPRARLPLADVAVLDPRDLRRRPVGERGRQGEDLLARHPTPGGQRRRRRRAAGAEARRVDHRAAQLEPADPPVVPGLARRERRPRVRGDPRERRTAACPTSSTRSAPPAASSSRRGATTSRSTRGATSSRAARSPGPYTLRSWVNDVRPPTVTSLTRRLSSGRPTIVAKIRDAKSGVDPLSLLLFFGRRLALAVGATLFDPATGIAAFSVPREALRAPARHGVHAGRRLRLPGDEEHQHGGRQPAAEHALPGAPRRGREPADRHLDHAREGRVPRGAPEAAGRRERQRPDLLGRLLRRQPADRPRAQERRGTLRDDLADRRQAARARTP